MIPLQINTPEAKTPLDVVVYELGMLNECCSVITDSNGYFDRVIPLEAFLIHARNLIDFLSGCCFPTDIKCTDFNDTGGKPIKMIKISITGDLKLRINRHCQHMSFDRLEKQIGWPINSIAEAINKGMSKFAEQLPLSNQASNILELTKGIRPRDTNVFYKKSH